MSVYAVLERLAPLVEKEVNLVLNSKKEVQNLSSKLKEIQEVLQDAERRGVTDPSVKIWLKNLQDLSYEMDDVLDEWETANLELQIQESEENNDVYATLGEKVSLFIQSLCSCFKHVVGRRGIALKTEGLSEKLDLIMVEKNKYNFIASGSENLGEFKRVESISLVDESTIYGRELDKDTLLSKLLSEGEENGTKIISVVGTGGVGKTTIAQLVYNDPKVDERFEFRTWICVSDPFDERGIAKDILEAAGKSSPDAGRLEILLQHVKNFVSGKKFLIVLDDVWTEDYRRWEPLKRCLKGLPGSRILVTTRNERVARMMGSCEIQTLGQLSYMACWSILSGIAFSGRRKEEREKLEDIGIKIAMKCKGLPLVARSMGSMLSFRNSAQEWQDVLDSPLWELEEVAEDVFNLLNFSYSDLSPVLKRCFSSCVIFPKDERIHVDKLFRIWLAHGYINSKGMVDKVHLKGLQYFENLAMRSFFQDVVTADNVENNVTATMHDIMHDFANFLSKSEYCFIMDGRVGDGKHSSHQSDNNLSLDMGKVRSFSARYVSQQELTPYLFSRLKRVRILSLNNCHLQELPQEIGELIHLRYLDLNNVPIQALPETLCNLYNLQTLDLEGCRELASLPQGIYKLINLRHLLIYMAPSLQQLPQGLEKLTGLWTLNRFKAGRGSSKLGCLQNLNQLRGSLFLFLKDMDEVDDLLEAEKAGLKNKIYIQELHLIFHGKVRMDVMNALRAPPNLQRLRLYKYNCSQFPDWITSLNYLRVLDIDNCGNCSSVPPFGKLPMLEKLTLFLMDNLEYVGNEFLGIDENLDVSWQRASSPSSSSSSSKETKFPRLKKLRFSRCRKWQQWEDIAEEVQHNISIMPCLHEIEIINCPELKALPHRLLHMTSSLEFLTIRDSELLVERYMKGSGDNWGMISHIPNVETAIRKVKPGNQGLLLHNLLLGKKGTSLLIAS